MSTTVSNNRLSTLYFYFVFIAALAFEGALVDGCLTFARDILHLSGFGPWLAWLVFTLGGTILAIIELRVTHEDQKVRDPLLRASCWLQHWDNPFEFSLGFIFATLAFGTMASAVALKKSGRSHQVALCCIAGILFATVWVPIFVFIWRS